MSVCRVTKQRDLEADGEFGFALVQVQLGSNARGRLVTSCVVEARDVDKTPERKKRPSGASQRLVYKALVDTLIQRGERRRVFDGVEVNCVSVDEWRVAAFGRIFGESKHKSTTFSRAVNALVGGDFVVREGELVWIP